MHNMRTVIHSVALERPQGTCFSDDVIAFGGNPQLCAGMSAISCSFQYSAAFNTLNVHNNTMRSNTFTSLSVKAR